MDLLIQVPPATSAIITDDGIGNKFVKSINSNDKKFEQNYNNLHCAIKFSMPNLNLMSYVGLQRISGLYLVSSTCLDIWP